MEDTINNNEGNKENVDKAVEQTVSSNEDDAKKATITGEEVAQKDDAGQTSADGKFMNRRRRWKQARKQPRICYFCAKGIYFIDYKDVELLSKYINNYCKIMPRRQTWCCNKHQGYLANAIKRARIVGLLPFIKID